MNRSRNVFFIIYVTSLFSYIKVFSPRFHEKGILSSPFSCGAVLIQPIAGHGMNILKNGCTGNIRESIHHVLFRIFPWGILSHDINR
jgi:hypothetical protein